MSNKESKQKSSASYNGVTISTRMSMLNDKKANDKSITQEDKEMFKIVRAMEGGFEIDVNKAVDNYKDFLNKTNKYTSEEIERKVRDALEYNVFD